MPIRHTPVQIDGLVASDNGVVISARNGARRQRDGSRRAMSIIPGNGPDQRPERSASRITCVRAQARLRRDHVQRPHVGNVPCVDGPGTTVSGVRRLPIGRLPRARTISPTRFSAPPPSGAFTPGYIEVALPVVQHDDFRDPRLFTSRPRRVDRVRRRGHQPDRRRGNQFHHLGPTWVGGVGNTIITSPVYALTTGRGTAGAVAGLEGGPDQQWRRNPLGSEAHRQQRLHRDHRLPRRRRVFDFILGWTANTGTPTTTGNLENFGEQISR